MLVLLGLLTRLATVPLLSIMGVAFYTTKWPILVHDGFWKMAHEARTDYAMLLGCLFLLMVGAGRWSIDAGRGSRMGAGKPRTRVLRGSGEPVDRAATHLRLGKAGKPTGPTQH